MRRVRPGAPVHYEHTVRPGAPVHYEQTVRRPALPRRKKACLQGLTLVHFSAQPEPFLTQNTP